MNQKSFPKREYKIIQHFDTKNNAGYLSLYERTRNNYYTPTFQYRGFNKEEKLPIDFSIKNEKRRGCLAGIYLKEEHPYLFTYGFVDEENVCVFDVESTSSAEKPFEKIELPKEVRNALDVRCIIKDELVLCAFLTKKHNMHLIEVNLEDKDAWELYYEQGVKQFRDFTKNRLNIHLKFIDTEGYFGGGIFSRCDPMVQQYFKDE